MGTRGVIEIPETNKKLKIQGECNMNSNLKFQDFAFDLPQELFVNDSIRETSKIKLMVVNGITGEIIHDKMENVTNYFNKNDILVFNNSGITKSRLKANWGLNEEVDICFLMQEDTRLWEVVVLFENTDPLGKNLNFFKCTMSGKILYKTGEFDGGYWVEHNKYKGYRAIIQISEDIDFLKNELHLNGLYMHPWYADLNSMDESLLNPVTSKVLGSVLLSEPSRRITKEMVNILKEKECKFIYPQLNMSFSWKPVEAEQYLNSYEMNYEEFYISQDDCDIINNGVLKNERIVSIGTSGVRILESLSNPAKTTKSRTNIFIKPGHKFKFVDCLLTNFHNSMGTHVIMASAIANRELIIKACEMAVKTGYRFGIHGDSMLVIGERKNEDV